MYTHANICIQISFSILLFASCFLPHSQRTMSLANYKTTPINILGVNYSSITLPKRGKFSLTHEMDTISVPNNYIPNNFIYDNLKILFYPMEVLDLAVET